MIENIGFSVSEIATHHIVRPRVPTRSKEKDKNKQTSLPPHATCLDFVVVPARDNQRLRLVKIHSAHRSIVLIEPEK